LLEALLRDRHAIATDINPVAVCISGAKANVPRHADVISRLDELKKRFQDMHSAHESSENNEFFRSCYHSATLHEIEFCKKHLDWQTDSVDRFIAALMLGSLHGESHRSELCLSNRMPRTISTKPEYSIRWWRKHGYTAPRREVFTVLAMTAALRYAKPAPAKGGSIVLADARDVAKVYSKHLGRVALIITSPPYLDVTDYAEDQWLRLWFLGGASRPVSRLNKDDRHTQQVRYWQFLDAVWKGVAPLLRPDAKMVIRMGGRVDFETMKIRLIEGIASATGRNVDLHSAVSGENIKRQTNAFRPGTAGARQEHDFVFSV
jgi:hypothetical protein